jgi:hypothetical protein
MDDVFGKGDITFIIAKESVKLAQGCILLFVAPCEFSVLGMNFFEVARVVAVSFLLYVLYRGRVGFVH